MHKKKTFWSALGYCAVLLVTLIALLLFATARWFDETFGIRFEELLFTLRTPFEDADTSFLGGIWPYFSPLLPFFCVAAVLLLVLRFSLLKEKDLRLCVKLPRGKTGSVSVPFLACLLLLFFSLILLFVTLRAEYIKLGISDYLYNLRHQTTLYEDYYVQPTKEIITAPEKKKNLLLIYMESMENTYASVEEGGYQKVNYIPNLTALAKENVSFSDTDELGGAHNTSGTGWTVAALFATSSGLPFRFPGVVNNMNKHTVFASGVTSLGDLLAEQGYDQEFLCGSKGNYAGRADYYTQHGGAQIYDYNAALKNGDIPEGYKVWWGFEDEYLYQIAKKELTRMAQEDAPFALTMLTVDTHHVGGYVCDLCQDEYKNQVANVVSCADRQIGDFINWCKEQDFYEDTVIVVLGDHPRMDSELVEDVKDYDRTNYNLFLNVDPTLTEHADTTNRLYTPMDMFPTILAALGNKIDGERLGIGTNLFSGRQTLCEEMGFDALNSEIARCSKYYIDTFS